MMKTEMTAEEILNRMAKEKGEPNFNEWALLGDADIIENCVIDAMHEFADQRYTPAEVMAIMEKVREEAASWIVRGAPIANVKRDILEIDLNKYLTK